MEKTKRNKKEFALDAKTRKLVESLSVKFILGCAGKSLAEIALLMSSFTCATLENICKMVGQDPQEFLRDFADLLKKGIDEAFSEKSA